MKRIGLHLLALCVLAPSGCADDEHDVPTCTDWDVPRSPRPDIPLRRQTEHLDIHSEAFVCAGMALEFERHIGFMAGQFELDLRTNIPVYLVESQPTQWCPDTAYGCTHSDGAVFTLPGGIEHELGHSAACELRRHVRPALAEGFAVMFQSSLASTQFFTADDDLREMLEADAKDLSYTNAGHFARWLFEREGAETFAALYRRAHGRKHTIRAIEDLYGASLDDLEAEYVADAPYAWVPFRQCADLPHVERDDDGVWRYSAMMDCENESTMGPYLRRLDQGSPRSQLMYQSFTFDVEESVFLEYDLQGDIEQVVFERCYSEHPSTYEDVLDGVPSISDADTGLVYHPDLEPGTWRANVLVVHGPPEPIGVALWDRY
jgi:hypothetical protein